MQVISGALAYRGGPDGTLYHKTQGDDKLSIINQSGATFLQLCANKMNFKVLVLCSIWIGRESGDICAGSSISSRYLVGWWVPWYSEQIGLIHLEP